MHSPGIPCNKSTFGKKVHASAMVGVEVQQDVMVQDYSMLPRRHSRNSNKLGHGTDVNRTHEGNDSDETIPGGIRH